MNPLTTVLGAIITGLVLLAILVLVITGQGANLAAIHIDRWLHIVSGITWIGLLYYFNVVQVPALAAAGADKGGPGGAGITKYVAPRALLWFRWAAVATWLTGAYYLTIGYGGGAANVHQAFALQSGFRLIGIGAWLGTIMLFNVWVFIWPNQKKILGIVTASDEEKATARKVALLASRINFALSLPMLLCMAGQGHGLAF
jgi:uncharacterized membrane protein